MRTTHGCGERLIAALSLVWFAVAAGAQTWTFSGGADGWTVDDFAGGSDWKTTFAMPGAYPGLAWESSGGSTGAGDGFVQAYDPSDHTFAFVAPTAQLGDYSTYLGGTLTFFLQCTGNNWGNDNVVVFRGGTDDSVIVAEINLLPATAWTDYSISLEAGKFAYNGKGGAAVSAEAFSKVMNNLTGFYISAEYVGSPPYETTGLDRVSFSTIPEPATTTALLGGAALLLAGWRLYRRRR